MILNWPLSAGIGSNIPSDPIQGLSYGKQIMDHDKITDFIYLIVSLCWGKTQSEASSTEAKIGLSIDGPKMVTKSFVCVHDIEVAWSLM